MIVLNAYRDPTTAGAADGTGQVFLASTWDEVLEVLNGKHGYKGEVKVAVYPGADVQYCDPATAPDFSFSMP
jgi:hypothetical protein